MKSPLLNIQNLNLFLKKTSENAHALQEISFEVRRGEIVGLVGESGSGKSLTVQSILQLLPHSLHQTTGQINFEGQNLLHQSEKNLRKIRGNRIGFVAQDSSLAFNPTIKIGVQLTEGLAKQNKKLTRSELFEEGLKWLKKMAINNPEQRMNQYPHELSGGMKQRMAIAMALICKPVLLLADEPTTALDVTVQAEILNLLKQLCREEAIGILLITHDLGVVANCCDRVLIMRKGIILESNEVDNIFTQPQHAYTRSLLKSKQSLSLGEIF